jgi:hypothetical protein
MDEEEGDADWYGVIETHSVSESMQKIENGESAVEQEPANECTKHHI